MKSPNWKRMAQYLHGYRRESVIAPLFKMLEALFDLFVPIVMADIINHGVANGDSRYILSRCGLLVLLGAIGFGCSIVAQYFAAKAAVGYAAGLRHALFSHIGSLSYSSLDTLGVSTLITRMTSDVNQVQSGLNLFLRLFLRSPFIVFGSLVMACTIDGRAALIFALVIPLLAIVVFGIILSTMPRYQKVQSRLDRVLSLTRENLAGVRVVRAFHKETEETERFEEANGALTKLQLRVGRLSALMNPLTYVIINLAVVAVLRTGAVRIEAGSLLPGDVIALINYLSQMLVELVKLANLIIQVTRALASAKRVNAVLETPAGMEFPASASATPNTDGFAVRFSHVGLQYAGAGAESLSDITFAVRAGETVGVIGGTGSGKTSLVNLIPRFYDATSGTVEVFGVPVKDHPAGDLRARIGIVPQRAQLFSGTIRSNLLYGNPDADDAALWEALQVAQAAEFVKAKPMQLDEPVEQGGRNLSGGQRQRLTIARALVRKPEILILDDSASALDYATDAALRQAIRRLPGGVTVFLVSQRAASLQNADQILVLDDGELVGAGTHDTLLQSCAVYREIYESQFRKGGED